jgi:hypothetical protein
MKAFRCSKNDGTPDAVCKFETNNQAVADSHILDDNACNAMSYTITGAGR